MSFHPGTTTSQQRYSNDYRQRGRGRGGSSGGYARRGGPPSPPVLSPSEQALQALLSLGESVESHPLDRASTLLLTLPLDVQQKVLLSAVMQLPRQWFLFVELISTLTEKGFDLLAWYQLCSAALLQSVQQHDWIHARLLVWHLSALRHQQALDWLTSFLDDIQIDICSLSKRNDFIVQLVSSVVLLLAPCFHQQQESLNSIVERLIAYAERTLTDRLERLNVLSPFNETQYVSCGFIRQLKSLEVFYKNQFQLENGLPQLHLAEASTSFSLPVISWPNPIEIYPKPEMIFNFLLTSAEGTAPWSAAWLPEETSVTAWYLHQMIQDQIELYRDNIKEGASFLTKPAVLTNATTTSYHLKSSVQQGAPGMARLVVERLFSLLLHPQHLRLIYPSAVLMSLCRSSPQTVPPALGRSIFSLFRLMPQLSFVMKQRLASYFAHHLSNFEFRWPWREWETKLNEANDNEASLTFVKMAMSEMVQLSYRERILETVPPSLHWLVSAAPRPEEAVSGSLVLTLIQNKASVDDILVALPTDWTAESIQQVTWSLLFSGNKSFSHMANLIERTMPVWQRLSSANASIFWQCIVSYWTLQDTADSHSNPWLEWLCDKLLNYRLLTSHTLVEWCVTAQDSMHLAWHWQMLLSVLQKVHSAEELSTLLSAILVKGEQQLETLTSEKRDYLLDVLRHVVVLYARSISLLEQQDSIDKWLQGAALVAK